VGKINEKSAFTDNIVYDLGIALCFNTVFNITYHMTRKKDYFVRGGREGIELKLYLNEREYEFLEKLASDRGVSMREIVLDAVRGVYEKNLLFGIETATRFLKTYIEMRKKNEDVTFDSLMKEVVGDVKEGSVLYNAFFEFWNTFLDQEYLAMELTADAFIYGPRAFYEFLEDRVKELKLKGFEPALFTVPCSICHKPMIFTHMDDNWENEEKPVLLKAFSNWQHIECKQQTKERYSFRFTDKYQVPANKKST